MLKSTKVFNTPELTEMILLCLPNKNLLGATRACSAFAAAYKNSVEIRRKLFMGDSPWPGYESVQGQTMPLNPMLFKDDNCLTTGPLSGALVSALSLKLDCSALDQSRITAESSCHQILICQPNITVDKGSVIVEVGTSALDSSGNSMERSFDLAPSKKSPTLTRFPTLGALLKMELHQFCVMEGLHEWNMSMLLTGLGKPAPVLDPSRCYIRLSLPDGVKPQLEGVDLVAASQLGEIDLLLPLAG